MSEPSGAAALVRLDQPHDTCFRCGRPTPQGVSLCDRDNPAHIKSPSSTQVHGTIVVGVIGGFVGLLLLLKLISSGAGPFTTSLSGVAARVDGGLDVVLTVANTGTRVSGASCRVSPGGAPDYRDYVFFTEPIPPGETRQFTKSLAAPQTGVLNASSVVVRCN
ncbi:MAG: hypothetical protein ABIP53_08765 [Candidatus Limnocylindrales bacterium]